MRLVDNPHNDIEMSNWTFMTTPRENRGIGWTSPSLCSLKYRASTASNQDVAWISHATASSWTCIVTKENYNQCKKCLLLLDKNKSRWWSNWHRLQYFITIPSIEFRLMIKLKLRTTMWHDCLFSHDLTCDQEQVIDSKISATLRDDHYHKNWLYSGLLCYGVSYSMQIDDMQSKSKPCTHSSSQTNHVHNVLKVECQIMKLNGTSCNSCTN